MLISKVLQVVQRLLLLCVLLWMVSGLSQAQNPCVDSMHRVIIRQPIDTVIINTQLHIARAYWNSHPDSSDYYTRNALVLALKSGYEAGQAFAFSNVASFQLLHNEDSGAVAYYFKIACYQAKTQRYTRRGKLLQRYWLCLFATRKYKHCL